MDLFKKNIIVIALLIIPMMLCAQKSLIEDFLPLDYTLSAKSAEYLKRYKAKASNIQLVSVNTNVIKEEQIRINTPIGSTLATRLLKRERNGNSHSWFGTLEDESGIYFSVMDNQLISKFSLNGTSYSLLPLEGKIHMLIETGEIELGDNHVDCIHEKIRPKSAKDDHDHNHDHHKSFNNKITGNDNACIYRIAIMYTDDAANNIGANLALFSQGLADEANLAYVLSGIDLVAEIARTIEVNHAESDVQINHPQGFQISEDVVTFHDIGDGVLDEIHEIRDLYQTDVQVLIRENLVRFTTANGTGTAFGVAWGVDVNNAADAFVALTDNSVTLGRFTFTHEIGHIQGAGHENADAAPQFARGFMFMNGAAGRTLMTRGFIDNNGDNIDDGNCGTSNGDGCRIGRFSNPDIMVGGVAIGTATRDNARRLDETADRTRNYRMTNDDLILLDETIGDEVLSHHLANNTITTGGNEIVYESGSTSTIRAGEEVLLTEETGVLTGANFRAFIGDCEEAAPLPFTSPEAEQRISQSDELPNTNMLPISKNRIKNYPNPFSESTTFEIQLQERTSVRLELFDLSGRLVKTLINNELMDSGTHQVELNAKQMQSGIYIYKFSTEQETKTDKVILEK